MEIVFGCIYVITCIINGKMYVGQHSKKDINERWRTHKGDAARGIKKNILYLAMRKHGIENFIIDIINVVPYTKENKNKLNYYENYFANLLDTYYWNKKGYNMAICGGGGNKYITEVTRDKLRVSHIGKKDSEETKKRKREALIQAHKEHPGAWAEAARKTQFKLKGVSNANWGSHTPNTNAQISKTLTGVPKTDAHNLAVMMSKTPGKTGEKYITETENGYYVRIHNKLYGNFEKAFPTLEEAINARDTFIENGIGLEKRKTITGEKYIKPTASGTFIVYITAKKVGFFSKTFPTLEEAIHARNNFISNSTLKI